MRKDTSSCSERQVSKELQYRCMQTNLTNCERCVYKSCAPAAGTGKPVSDRRVSVRSSNCEEAKDARDAAPAAEWR